MDLVTLEIFKAVASELSITRAASQLGRVQSNVTTRIQNLETELGVELFNREGKRLRLSEQGMLFLEYTNRLLCLADEAKQSMHPNSPHGILRVGAMESTAATRLPSELIRFHQACPDVSLLITTGPSQKLTNLLKSGEIDCALLALPHEFDSSPQEYLKRHNLNGEQAYEEKLRLVLPFGSTENDLLKKVPRLSLAAFQSGCSYRGIISNWVTMRDDQSNNPLIVNEVGSYHLMLACVAAGQSFSIIPEGVLDLSPSTENYQVASEFSVTTWLIWRSDYAAPAFQLLKSLLQETYSKKFTQ